MPYIPSLKYFFCLKSMMCSFEAAIFLLVTSDSSDPAGNKLSFYISSVERGSF